jgi:ribosomal-protein-alanine N-acetyltransferase
MTVLHTERLTLRPLAAADAELYAGMRYHPEVAKWLSPAPDGLDPADAARATIGRFEQSWRERRYAPWGVFRDGRLIGHGGLNWVPEFGETEVLWALHPDAWRQGYATETARAALDYGFKDLGLELIFAIAKPDNHPSQAVMTRLGMSYRKNVVYRGFDAVWLDISREKWLGAGAVTPTYRR